MTELIEFTNEIFYNSGRADERALHRAVSVLVYFISCHENLCLGSRWLAMDWFVAAETCYEPLASNGLPLWLYYSGFQASCHSPASIFRLNSKLNMSSSDLQSV
jgi:hypothetical protein